MSALSTEQVLREEADDIAGLVSAAAAGTDAGHPASASAREERVAPPDPERPKPARAYRNAKLGVAPEDHDECEESRERQQTLYQKLNRLDRAALCLSGGGIRSAAFGLGVIQALATHPRPLSLRAALSRDRDGHATPSGPPKGPAKGRGRRAMAAKRGPPAERRAGQEQKVQSPRPERLANAVENAQGCLLAKVHYLSTVSGGGYIGSWFSAWCHRTNFETVWRNLVARPCGPDVEPGTIGWLRAYSNYLTPKLGLMSADTWSAVAIFVRNLILNWLVIIPFICLVLLGLKLFAVVSIGLARADDPYYVLDVIAGLGVLCLIVALRFTTRSRPTRYPPDAAKVRAGIEQGPDQWDYLRGNLLWSGLSAIALTLFVASDHGLEILGIPIFGLHSKWLMILIGAGAGAIIYSIAWLVAWTKIRHWRDFFVWTASGLVYGALVAAGAYFYTLAPMEGLWIFNDLLLPLLFGIPWILAAQLITEMIFVGLSSFEQNSDSDREWLGRAGGWVAVTALCWFLVTLFTVAGSLPATDFAASLRPWLASLGGVSGVITAVVGKSAWSPARSDSQGARPLPTNIILAVAAPLFAAILVVTLSASLDQLLFGEPLATLLRRLGMDFGAPYWSDTFVRLVIAMAIAGAIAWVASYSININRFSLHSIYRNRLIRAFLGASNPKRSPNAFTGFDLRDNLRIYDMWPPTDGKRRPFHVINMALNIVSSKDLAWQERKAESFTVSALHSGSACKAFRSSRDYGNPRDPTGISLGTAMAISGAAASPNMGYHSSPAVTFLLALFNVRLGWWLGNPGPEGDATYTQEGPNFAIGPLLHETFGLTTDDRPYVYLSDGGHFENLGLYEMVRRRCRFIICVDAGADSDFAFEDLGNAVRKIRLDLGITVRFHGLSALKKRPKEGDIGPRQPYHAIAEIDYPAADGGGDFGTILYIKAGYHGVESAGVRSYAIAHPEFPHEGTIDQFFSESQFESYRALGFEISDALLDRAVAAVGNRFDPTLEEIFEHIVTFTRDDLKRIYHERTAPGAAPATAG